MGRKFEIQVQKITRQVQNQAVCSRAPREGAGVGAGGGPPVGGGGGGGPPVGGGGGVVLGV